MDWCLRNLAINGATDAVDPEPTAQGETETSPSILPQIFFLYVENEYLSKRFAKVSRERSGSAVNRSLCLVIRGKSF